MNAIDVSKIFGKIRIVKRFPDYKIQVVPEGADLEVELVESCCYATGKWKLVSIGSDFNIMLVHSHPDFTVSCSGDIKPVR